MDNEAGECGCCPRVLVLVAGCDVRLEIELIRRTMWQTWTMRLVSVAVNYHREPWC